MNHAKIVKYKNGETENLIYMHFIHDTPESGKQMLFTNDKLGRVGYLKTSKVRWLAKIETKNRVRYYAKTYNSTYRVTINKEDIYE